MSSTSLEADAPGGRGPSTATNTPAAESAADLADAVQFFAAIYAECTGAVQFVAIGPDGARQLHFVRPPYDWPTAMRWALEKSDAGCNVYFAVATQPPDAAGDRTKQSARELPALFADVDLEGDGGGLIAAGLRLLLTARFTALVCSGYGWHPYAKLPQPIRLTAENGTEVEDLLYAFGAALNVEVRGVPRKVDRFDLASLLRVPGTINWPNAKKGAKGRVPAWTWVAVNRSGSDIPLDAFEDCRAQYWRPANGASTEGKGGDGPGHEADAEPGALPPDWETWLAQDPILRARFERTEPGPKQKDLTPSGFLCSLFNHLALKYSAKISRAEALAVGLEFYRRAGAAKDARAIDRTWRAAKSYATIPDPGDTTDLGNGRRFAHRNAAKARYVYGWKRWHVYDGTRWAPDVTGEVQRLAQETAETMLREAFGLPADDPTRAERIKRAVSAKSRNRLLAMIELAQPLCAARPEDFDRDPFVINCQNGTLDFGTGELRPHDPADMITKIVPVSYDRTGASCPGWLRFLDRIFEGNQRLITYIQRALGAALVGVMQDQCFHIFYGGGANGKSTLIEVIRAVLGAYAKHAAATTFLNQRNTPTIRSDLARLRDARLVTATETSKGCVLDEATIKALTGGDTITARHLYQGEEEFRPAAHLFLLTNHKPRIKGADHAIWRRVRLFPFNATIPPEEQDLNLRDKLLTELPGIFAWIVEGALAVQRADGRLDPVPEVIEAVRDYREQMDVVGRFLADKCEEGKTFRVGAKDLRAAYVGWCTETSTTSLFPTEFNASLAERGFEQKRNNRGVFWIGLRLKEQPEETVEEMILDDDEAA